ncbi:MAG: hypothetical protein OHK0029_03800 [Armatimonadaceae bacterium]
MEAFRGIGLVLRTGRLRKLCVFPLLLSLAVYAGVGIFGGIFAIDFLDRFLDDTWLAWTRPILILLWLVLFPFLFTALAGVFFPMFFDRLSLAVEETVAPGSTIPNAPPPLGTALRDTFARIVFNAFLTVGALLLSVFLPLGPIPWFIATGIIGLLDFSAPAFLRRGITLGPQTRHLLPPTGGTFGFAITAGLLLLIPIVGVFFLPGLVAGGTLLARKHSPDPPVVRIP